MRYKCTHTCELLSSGSYIVHSVSYTLQHRDMHSSEHQYHESQSCRSCGWLAWGTTCSLSWYIDDMLCSAERVEVFLIVPVTPILCEDLDMLWYSISNAGVNGCIDQHILCCWGYDTGNDIGECVRVSHVGASNVSYWHRSPGVPDSGYCHCSASSTQSINSLL